MSLGLTFGWWSSSANAACTTISPGVFTCSGAFLGDGIIGGAAIFESDASGIDLTAVPGTTITTDGTIIGGLPAIEPEHGIFALSVGAKGADGRDASDVPRHASEPGDPGHASGNITVRSNATIDVSGSGAVGILGKAVAGNGGQGGDAAVGRNSKAGGDGGDNSAVVVFLENSGSITTHGTTGIGIVGQNHGGIGGKGGDGSFAGGSGSGGGGGGQGGSVSITNDGSIVTNADHSAGIFSHSVGGFGGDGGSDVGFVGFGGNGGSAGRGGNVTAVNVNTITTLGNHSNGIYAQSVGGGGGRGGNGAGVVGLGGFGAIGGNGGTVAVTNGTAGAHPDVARISTSGTDSIAIFAQSIGGTGGDGGDSAGIEAIGGNATEGGVGGSVTISNNGTVITSGRGAFGIFAQSIGGGGGHGGSSGGVAAIGGRGGDGGNGGVVNVDNSTNAIITTNNIDAGGIFAQSVGGGGGNGGSSTAIGAGIAVAIGGNGGLGGQGSTVTVVDCTQVGGVCESSNGGQITTGSVAMGGAVLGDRSHGIHAQSIGGGGGRGGYAIAAAAGPFAFSAALGGSGAGGGNGSTVNVSSNSNITTLGQHSYGISAESIGGGGGSGGFAIAATASEDLSVSAAFGGSGAGGGDGGIVNLDALGAIMTSGDVSHGLFAQSVGGGGGNGGFAISGAIGTGLNASAAFGGTGAGGGAGNNVTVNATGAITTAGNLSNGIHAQSIGGGGGHGGFAVAVSATTDTAGLSFGLGGSGGGGGDGGDVTVTSDGTVTTSGDGANAIFAQSLGGGGGSGGFSGAFSLSLGDGKGASVAIGGAGGPASHGGVVKVTQNGDVTTSGTDSVGIVAQSIGGGGGHGGFGLSASVSTSGNFNATAAVGGSGGAGGDGETVTVNSDGMIATAGERAHGIHAQSIGGGGGTGGFAISGDLTTTSGSKNIALSIGGSGGVAGTAEKVTVTTTQTITTDGRDAVGILAQSIGGGGGNGGMAVSGAMSGNSSRNLAFSLGGDGGAGGDAGNIVVLANGQITTAGDRAHGVQAQSIGKGGGSGGLATSLDLTNGGDNTQINISIGGNGAGGGKGGAVDVSVLNGVTTTGYDAVGVWVQSIGGGGGAGGSTGTYGIDTTSAGAGKVLQLGVAVGGSGGAGSTADAVSVTTDGLISTSGDISHAIIAQSIGGGGGRGGSANSFSFFAPGGDGSKDGNKNLNVSVGGGGGTGNDAGTVFVTNKGHISTAGTDSYGIFAQSIGGGGGEGGHGDHSSHVPLPIVGTTSPPKVNQVEFLKNINVAVGGSGGGSGDGKDVDIVSGDRATNTAASISTQGDGSFGVFAQSIGGGGGIGGYGATALTGTVGIGGSGGSAGDGGDVDVDILGDITTRGTSAYAILAQSIGGGGGVGGNVKRGFKNVGVGIGGGGGGGGTGNDVAVTSEGTISTSGEGAHGIVAQSIGGGGGIGGDVGTGAGKAGSNGDIGDAGNVTVHHTGTIITTGHGAKSVFAQSNSAHGVGVVDVTVTSVATTGDEADAIHVHSAGNHAGNLTVAVGDVPLGGIVMTTGDDSIGVRAVSEIATTNAADVTIKGQADVVTTGARAAGVLAKSMGIGAGAVDVNLDAGMTMGEDATVVEAVSDGTTASGGTVTVNMTGALHATGARSAGIVAKSLGVMSGVVNVTSGGGLTTGDDATVVTAISKATTGDGKNVTVTVTGGVEARGANSQGILAMSQGVGAGVVDVTFAGAVTLSDMATAVSATSDGTTGAGQNVTVQFTGDVQTAGTGALGVEAISSGVGAGEVLVTGTGNVITAGDDAIGIYAESLGGGGAGSGVTVTYAGNLLTSGDRAHGIRATSTGTGSDNIRVTTAGSITTTGQAAHGVFADSAGAGAGGEVDVIVNGDVAALGLDSDALRLEADAGMALNLQIAEVNVQGGSGDGVAVRFVGGGTNLITNLGTLSALSETTIVGTTGDDTVINSGTVFGDVDLGGGINAFFNQAGANLFANDRIALGGGTLTNAGNISPGGAGVVATTAIGGNYIQTGSGKYLLDADFSPAPSDLITATGTANLSGEVVVNLQQLDEGPPITILTADGGVTLDGLFVQDTLAVDYEFVNNGTELQLVADYEFDVPDLGLNRNQAAITKSLDSILAAGGDIAFSPLLVELAKITDPAVYRAAIQAINPEAHFASVESVFDFSTMFPETLLSCREADGPYAPVAEGQCLWARVDRMSARQKGDTRSVEYSETASNFAGGVQFAVSEAWRIGLSVGYGESVSKSEDRYRSEGTTTSGGFSFKYVTGPSLFAVAFTGGYFDADGLRTVAFGEFSETAASETEVVYGAVRLRAARVLTGGMIYAKPILDIDVTHLNLMKLRETGNIISVEADSSNQTLVSIKPAVEFGARLRLSETTELRPFAGVSLTYNPTSDLDLRLRFKGAQDGVAPFQLESALDEFVRGVSAGLDIIDDGFGALSLRYDGEFSEHRHQHIGSAKLTVNF